MMHRVLVILWVMAACLFSSGRAWANGNGPVKADIVWLIDTSGSMYDKMDDVKTLMTSFNGPIVDAGIDACYGLVEFGGVSGNADTQASAALVQDLVDFTTFTAPDSPFSKLGITPMVGATEKGSLATAAALAYATFRQDARINLILVTDEDDDTDYTEDDPKNLTGPYPKVQIVSDMLSQSGAWFNFIGVFNDTHAGNPDYDGIQFNTSNTYSVLAATHGGTGFDILQLQNDPEAFFNYFVRVKLEELSPDIPEPGMAVLMATGGLLTMIYSRRTRRRKGA